MAGVKVRVSSGWVWVGPDFRHYQICSALSGTERLLARY